MCVWLSTLMPEPQCFGLELSFATSFFGNLEKVIILSMPQFLKRNGKIEVEINIKYMQIYLDMPSAQKVISISNFYITANTKANATIGHCKQGFPRT